MTFQTSTDPSQVELTEDFGILITDALDRWRTDPDDPRGVDEVITGFIQDPAHSRFVGAVLAGAGWRPPPGPCSRDILKRSHGQGCTLTQSARSW